MNVRRRNWLWAGAIVPPVIAAFYLAGWMAVPSQTQPGSRSGTPRGRRESAWQHEYWDAVARAERADETRNWSDAARQYGRLIALLPHDPISRFKRAAALAHLGRDQESLQELRWAVEFGWTRVDSLGRDTVFNRIAGLEQLRGLRERAREIADETVALYVPESLNTATPAPLVVTFHGLGENEHRYIWSWREAADRLGLVVAAPRGIERIRAQADVLSYRWVTAAGRGRHSDVPRCRAILARSIALAKTRAHIDQRRIILAGYSQGGSVALRLLADTPARWRGAVVEATAFSPRTLDEWQPPRSDRRVRACVIVHEFDRMRPVGERACHALEDAGIDTRLIVVPGADHELPMDGGARLIEALRFVLGPDSTAR